MTSFTPTLAVINGIPRASSLDIAQHFGKRHVDVMRAINKSITQVPEDFAQRNFAFSDYRDSTGRTFAKCDLTHDGFSFVVMGFTGKEAAKWKVVYIAAFRAMADELAAQREAALPHVPHIQITPSTPTSRKPLRSLVNVWARLSGQHQDTLWPQVKAHFQLERIDDLPEEWIPDAITWVQGKIDALPKALPAPKPMRPPLLSLTPEELAALDKAAQRVEELNRYVRKEISDLHVDILESVDPSRMARTAWRVLSDYIFYSLLRAVDLPSGCLEGEKNPALAMKMLAGVLDER